MCDDEMMVPVIKSKDVQCCSVDYNDGNISFQNLFQINKNCLRDSSAILFDM